MNNSDLRVRKTRRAIRSAFLELAKEKPVEKITVKELSERAEINKATFYSHYETIYALIDELEQEAVDMVIEQMKNSGSIREHPREYVRSLASALSSSSLTLFIGSSTYETKIHDRLLAALREISESRELNPRDYERRGVIFSFLIQGLIGALRFSPDLTERNLDAIADLIADGADSLR